MNKKDQLLTDALTNGEGESFALAAATRARRRQATKQLGVAAGVLAVAFAVWFAPYPPTPIDRTALAPLPAYDIISDAELLLQLKDQPVLILKDEGRITRVLFLNADRKL